MNITFHLPKTEKGTQELQKRMAEVHAEAVSHYLQTLNCTQEQKKALIEEIKKA